MGRYRCAYETLAFKNTTVENSSHRNPDRPEFRFFRVKNLFWCLFDSFWTPKWHVPFDMKCSFSELNFLYRPFRLRDKTPRDHKRENHDCERDWRLWQARRFLRAHSKSTQRVRYIATILSSKYIFVGVDRPNLLLVEIMFSLFASSEPQIRTVHFRKYITKMDFLFQNTGCATIR